MKFPPSRRTPTLERLESRWVRAGLPYGAVANDTGEFMLGRVAVTPVFLESTGQIDASTENWNAAHTAEVVNKIHEAFGWWKDLLATQTSVHSLDFVIDPTYIDTPSPTAYEPINRRSDDYSLWSQEFLMRAGYDEFSSLEQNMRAFNNAQREKLNADWSFTMFVVDSQVDVDGTFLSTGTFSRAFAFAGGLFTVIPSTRPASTFAHETGHMFWARDEYPGSASYFAQRGYYNTQNTNAIDANPDPNFQQAASIMSSGSSLNDAYSQIVSPVSTLSMLGWKDSDGDGIFDLMDVPLLLDGVGRVDVNSGNYRFSGTAKVQTLPNLNPSGLGNDITLNRISRIEAKIGAGAWQTVATPDVYEATVELSIPLAGVQSSTIQIRAIDDETGITSNVFTGQIGAVPDATTPVGISGFFFNDANANGLFDAIESGSGANTVRLVDASGVPISLERRVEPDTQVPGVLSSTAFPNVAITAIGSDTNGLVGAFNDPNATTSAMVFRPYSINRQGYSETWNVRRQLRVSFASDTSTVSVDVIGGGSSASYGRLEAYNSSGVLIARVTSDPLPGNTSQKLTIGRDTADIAYVLVYGHMETGIKIDNLRYGPQTQTQTDSSGRYSFTGLPAGVYHVQAILPGVTSHVSTSAGEIQTVNLQALQTVAHIDYGINFQNTAWHNTRIAEDVNDDGNVTAFDALLVINLLNSNTPSALTGSDIPSSPYIDVSNDAFLSALDALLVINKINGAGEGEVGSSQALVTAGGNQGGEGESCLPFEATAAEQSSTITPFEGEFTGPAVPVAVTTMTSSAPAPAGESSDGNESRDTLATDATESDCVVDQLAGSQAAGQSTPVHSTGGFSDADVELIRRLEANPWSLPQPCNCADCLAIELTDLRTQASGQ